MKAKPPKTHKRRKIRSDKGSHHIIKRDPWILRWIGEQYVARFDHLQVLLGQDPQGVDKTPRILTENATRKVIAT